MKSLSVLLSIFFGAVLILQFSFSDAYAYLDPGSGSLVIQMIIGALVGVGITLKLYWYKFKEKIFGINKKNE